MCVYKMDDLDEFNDFLDEVNSDHHHINDQEKGVSGSSTAFDCEDLINGLLEENQLEEMLFGFSTVTTSLADHDHPPLIHKNDFIDNNDIIVPVASSSSVPITYDQQVVTNNDGDDSSATSTETTTTRKKKKKKGNTDRSRTLVLERTRRGKMKDELYALRSLVPNITNMDKASIIGDAISYVQELQMQGNKLEEEISDLEASFNGGSSHRIVKKINTSNHPIIKKIKQMDMFEVEERGFYVRLRVMCSSSNKGEGIAASLYKALESLTAFDVQNSNFTTTSDDHDHHTCLLTFTLNVKENMNLSDLKIWVTDALLNQGFAFLT